MAIFLLLKERCGVTCHDAPSLTGGLLSYREYYFILFFNIVYLHSLHSRPISPGIVQQIMLSILFVVVVKRLKGRTIDRHQV
jgi:hypothetical protein